MRPNLSTILEQMTHDLRAMLRFWWFSTVRPSIYHARNAAYDALDTHVFPRIEAYTTHRAHITFMALLWLALLLGGGWTAFELVGGNYTNGLSGLMTCIIALQQARHVRENRAQHAATHRRLDDHERRLATIHRHVAPPPPPRAPRPPRRPEPQS